MSDEFLARGVTSARPNETEQCGVVGCIGCGEERSDSQAYWVACPQCKRTVALCHPCGRARREPLEFLSESMFVALRARVPGPG